MKKTVLLTIALLLGVIVPQQVRAFNYNFAKQSSSGQVLYYAIIVGPNPNVSVTHPNYGTDADGTGNYYYNFSEPTGDLVIPSTVTWGGTTYTVTSIESCAFHSCSGLTSVTIPSSVTSIEFGAFKYCTGLTSVVLRAKSRHGK